MTQCDQESEFKMMQKPERYTVYRTKLNVTHLTNKIKANQDSAQHLGSDVQQHKHTEKGRALPASVEKNR